MTLGCTGPFEYNRIYPANLKLKNASVKMTSISDEKYPATQRIVRLDTDLSAYIYTRA